jgi:hypothetical protein
MHKYAVGGIAIGIMQVVDAIILYSRDGACEGASLALAGIEFIWAVTSLVVAIRASHLPTRLLALAFFAYNLVGWLLGVLGNIEAAQVMVPMWFVIFGGIFGLLYTGSSVYVAKRP